VDINIENLENILYPPFLIQCRPGVDN